MSETLSAPAVRGCADKCQEHRRSYESVFKRSDHADMPKFALCGWMIPYSSDPVYGVVFKPNRLLKSLKPQNLNIEFTLLMSAVF